MWTPLSRTCGKRRYPGNCGLPDSDLPDGAYQAAHNLRQVQRLADLDARLPALLAGKEQAKDATDRLALAWLCNLRQQRYAAVRWYNEALN